MKSKMSYPDTGLFALVITLLPVLTRAVILESTFNDTVAQVRAMLSRVADLETNLRDLAKQTQLQQLEVEERVRSEGNSGIKQVRYVTHGTSSYFDYTHLNLGVASIHDHTNYHDTLGMGEVIAVINGVEFRSVHRLGFWSLETTIREPFSSDRHALFASSWAELQQQIFYTSYTGTKDLSENMAFLPTAIISVNSTSGKPVYAQWNYRILCNPTSMDIPLRYFRVQDDLASRTSLRNSFENVNNTRAGRFRLSEYDYERNIGFTLLDQIMLEIPGLDNNPQFLNETAFGMTLYSNAYGNYTKLNTGYYHRSYKTGSASAMGVSMVDRGFSDEMMFVAETTQTQVAAFDFTICIFRGPCTTRSSRFSYAIPLEIVYMTPLLTWNPYNITVYSDYKIPPANGRTGSTTQMDKAFNGSSSLVFYYLTPKEFYSSTTGQADPADTAIASVGVLDKTGQLRNVTASGVQIFTLPIRGLGSVRIRYPIPPVHGEGSTVWKDLSILKQTVRTLQGAGSAGIPAYQMQLYSATIGGLHTHDFTLLQQDYNLITRGEVVSVVTSLANGHQHNLNLWLNPASNVLEYQSCDYQDTCFDGHPKNIRVVTGPGRKK